MSGVTTRTKVDFHSVRQGKRVLAKAQKPESPPRVPLVARLLALAIGMAAMVQSGEVADYAELPRLGRVTKARMSQIMDLLLLAPDIQEEILFLPAAAKSRDPVTERQLRAFVAEVDWGRQRGCEGRWCGTARVNLLAACLVELRLHPIVAIAATPFKLASTRACFAQGLRATDAATTESGQRGNQE